MKYFSTLFLILVLTLVSLTPASATHLRAGVITAKLISGRTYEFTVRLYINFGSSGIASQDKIDFYPGDGSVIEDIDINENRNGVIGKKEILTQAVNNVQLNTWIITVTYNAPGVYKPHIGTKSGNDEKVEYIPNRNGGINNIRNQNGSSEVPFYIETLLVVGTTNNSTPLFLNPPIDQACPGTRFTYNPAAFDPDGDSLSYVLTTPWEAQNKNVPGYRNPNDATFNGKSETGGTPLFQIDPLTGTLTWNAPGNVGEYNLAFLIEEWRNGVRIGYVRVDMQVLVKDCGNKRPEIKVPNDTCVVAGTKLDKLITATDPDIPAQDLTITAFGGVFDASFSSPRATFIFNPTKQKSEAKGNFSWQTSCSHIREEPYTIVFRVEDFPANISTKLTDTKAWRVTVIGPAPTNLTATPLNKSVRLNWDNYLAKCDSNTTREIIIYRKRGCDNRKPGYCELGVPASWGYEEIGRVPAGTTTFLDTNKGAGLPKGIKYSYRIVASFGFPGNGLSYASDEVCIALVKDVPFITNVSVEKTSQTAGEIFVKWTHPLEFNTSAFPGPYTYKVFRTTGVNPPANAVYSQVYSRTVSAAAFPSYPRTTLFTGGVAADTSFTDTGLNTEQNAYTYRIAFYYNNPETFKDSSTAASSVRLVAAPGPASVNLNWTYNVPWNNNGQYHRIYRKVNGTFVTIDSILVNANGIGTYTDVGKFQNKPLILDSTYCYFIETQGKYPDFELSVKVFRNKSQESCSTPRDTTKPCPPVLAIQSVNCDVLKNETFDCSDPETPDKLENKLFWTNLYPKGCDRDIASYKLYYKPYQEDSLQFLVAVTDTFYTHFNTINNIISVAGCYAVSAVDKAGNESALSNIVCVDNCPYYALPNLITPENGDDKNDVLKPCPQPRFVQSVNFKVYNRWGKQVFEKNDDIYLNWSGRVGEGDVSKVTLSSGIYYYSAEVQFIRLSRKDGRVRLKGWIMITK
jgi:hypothetical protein